MSRPLGLYAIRVASAASYLTLIAADSQLAGALAAPYALAVLLVAVRDMCAKRRYR